MSLGGLTEGMDVLDFDRNLAGNTSDDVPKHLPMCPRHGRLRG